MARNPDRIPTVVAALERAWKETPDMRLGQLIVNMCGRRDPFMVEDDVMLDELRDWLETSKTWKGR